MHREIETVGFIGLGVMGERMCRHLAEKGTWRVLANDLDPAPLERLAHGGVEAATVDEMLKAADMIVTCLPGGEQVEALALGPQGFVSRLRPEQVYVDMSTSPPDLMRRIADALPEGALSADAPVARTRAAAERGELLIMVGGPEESFALVEPVLATMGSDVVHCGPNGAGQVAKILNNMVLFETVAALAEAVEVGERSGMNAEALLDVLSLGSANSFALNAHGRNSLAPQDYPERSFSVRYAAKDLSYARRLGQETGVRTPGADHVAALFEEAIAEGAGGKYFPVIRKLLHRRE